MDRYVGLYHQVLTTNAIGESVESWPTAYANVWAKKLDTPSSRHGDKSEIADQFAQLQFTDFQIYYRTDLLATDHLVDDNGLQYEIVQVGEIGRHEGLALLCKAVKP